MPLLALDKYQEYSLSASIRIFTTSPSIFVFCAWRKALDWQTSTTNYGGSWSSYTNSSRAQAEVDTVAYLNTAEDYYLTCDYYGNGGIYGGYISAQKVKSTFAGIIGG